MNRADLFIHMLDSTAKLHQDISLILSAKAHEAEKSRNWVCNHMNAANLPEHDQQMKRTGDIHEQIIELIDGLTKMENALNRQLQALLEQKEDGGDSGSGGGPGFGDMFSFGSEK